MEVKLIESYSHFVSLCHFSLYPSERICEYSIGWGLPVISNSGDAPGCDHTLDQGFKLIDAMEMFF